MQNILKKKNNKKIKPTQAKPENFDVCFWVLFERQYQKFISAGETDMNF